MSGDTLLFASGAISVNLSEKQQETQRMEGIKRGYTNYTFGTVTDNLSLSIHKDNLSHSSTITCCPGDVVADSADCISHAIFWPYAFADPSGFLNHDPIRCSLDKGWSHIVRPQRWDFQPNTKLWNTYGPKELIALKVSVPHSQLASFSCLPKPGLDQGRDTSP